MKKGFTLIELLVVISIIAVLSAIGFVTYQSILKGGRDAKRQSDLRTIQSALEQYHNDLGFYPQSQNSRCGASCYASTIIASGRQLDSNTGWASPPMGPAVSPVKIYLNATPTDPTPPQVYLYGPIPAGCDNNPGFPTSICTSYCLYAKLENISTPDLKGCTANGSNNFALTPP